MNNFDATPTRSSLFQSFKIGPASYPVPANAAQLHIEGKFNQQVSIYKLQF